MTMLSASGFHMDWSIIVLLVIWGVALAVSGTVALIGWGMRDELKKDRYDPELRHPMVGIVARARVIFGICLCIGGGIAGLAIGMREDGADPWPTAVGLAIGGSLAYWLDRRFGQ